MARAAIEDHILKGLLPKKMKVLSFAKPVRLFLLWTKK